MRYELGFIGGGNMAEAIVRAAVDRQVVKPEKIIIADPVAERASIFEPMGVKVVFENPEAIRDSRQIVLAIKPQSFPTLAEELREISTEKQVLISIMAGVTTKKIETSLRRGARIIRVMPNTPLLVGLGMSAVAVGSHARSGDELLAMQLFSAAGEAIRVDESALDAVTAVSGSGPAYTFYLAEAMIEVAESLGLSPEHAAQLTKQTILGAAQLMKDSPETPSELRKKVTSAGGTTQAALEHMESQDLKRHIAQAIHKAAQRSAEMGKVTD